MVFLDSTEHIYFPAGTEQCIVRHRFLEHRLSPRAEEKDASSLSIVSIYTPHLKLPHALFNLLIVIVLCITYRFYESTSFKYYRQNYMHPLEDAKLV